MRWRDLIAGHQRFCTFIAALDHDKTVDRFDTKCLFDHSSPAAACCLTLSRNSKGGQLARPIAIQCLTFQRQPHSMFPNYQFGQHPRTCQTC